MSSRILVLLALAAANLFSQNASYPYVFKTLAGNYPLGDGGPATKALLLNPTAVALDAAGNLYIADGLNYRIRKVDANGVITTLAACPSPTDMKLGKDGNLYLASSGVIFKVSTSTGALTVLAGNSVAGFSGDGGPAAQAQVGATAGIALDSNNNIFFVDGFRIREITAADGKIQTIAGTGNAGAGTDNVSPLSTNFFYPTGLAVDGSNNLYVVDRNNFSVRKIAGGIITTVAGTGKYGQAVPGPAKSSPIGVPSAVAFDSSGNMYVSDTGGMQVFKIDTNGILSQIAGQQAVFGYSDGPAATTYLNNPYGLTPDNSGGLYIVDLGSSRIRHLAGGTITTIAGMLHYAGDNGPAASALLYNPVDQVIDAQGNVYILDEFNYRIRKVAPNGVISTFAGNGIQGTPGEGAAAASGPLPLCYSIAIDGQGNLYLGCSKIYKITPAGLISTFAGADNAPFGSGNGGPALQAGFLFVTSLAVDSSGNVYLADTPTSRIQKITTDGKINNFAGNGTSGNTGDGGLATSAEIAGGGPLATDAAGNVYIGAGGSNVVRMVNPGGIISTVAGNGTAGSPADGSNAKTSPFSPASGLATDAAGNLYIMSGDQRLYRLDSGGVIHVIAGGGTTAIADGGLANTSARLGGHGIRVTAAGDILVADPGNAVIRQLVLDSPTGVAVAGGNNQSGAVGAALANPITVTVSGRAGVNVPGVTVNFAVTSGSATLSAASSQTDSTGTAGVSVTLGSSTGTVTITATAAGTTLAAATFTETATNSNPSCTIGVPVITSVRSLGDFGGLSAFSAGSWLEIKGSNLATDARLWAGSDFSGSNAPKALDGSSVSINGNAAFVEYISAGQINVQAPADSATGQVPVTVTNCGGTSNSVNVQEAATAPGILATSAFNIGGKQYMVALYQDGVTFVGNTGLIAGVPFRPAKPGDAITTYGIGFGPVTPASAPGVVVAQQNAVPNLTVSFGQTPAATTYAGLAPGAIGLYQFDITVPNVPNGDYQINIAVGGVAVQQTVYLTVSQ